MVIWIGWLDDFTVPKPCLSLQVLDGINHVSVHDGVFSVAWCEWCEGTTSIFTVDWNFKAASFILCNNRRLILFVIDVLKIFACLEVQCMWSMQCIVFMRRCRFRTVDHPIDPHICDMITHVYDGGNKSTVTSTWLRNKQLCIYPGPPELFM